MIRLSIHAAFAALLLIACSREKTETIFRTVDTDYSSVATRSILTGADIETKKTEITLAAYGEEGTLATCGHFTKNLESLPLELEHGRNYTIYALVNMGDQTGTIPRSESALSTLTYRIPSYSDGPESIASRGIPMAGKISYPNAGTNIPVERLLAKITAQISCEWPGASIRSARVCQLNRVLRPFGEAAWEEDWDQQEFHEGTGTSSGTFVFYVPENRQGTISGISSSREKSPDGNAQVNARKGQLTYLETVVEGTEIYVGSITYRSYLGQNAVSDFDIRRNARYNWTIRYLNDGLQYNDWKHGNDLIDTQSGLHIDDGWDDGGEEELH